MAHHTTRQPNMNDLLACRHRGEKLALLTCYDASFAALLHACGVDALLVGDSLGNVIQGHRHTLAVRMEHMVYHTSAVTKGAPQAFVIADMPVGSYQESPQHALRHALLLLAAGAQMVKLEGGEYMAETVRFLTERGVPVCGHIGLTPQAVHQLGGYRLQGKTTQAAKRLQQDAQSLQEAGAHFLVLEMLPEELAKKITHALNHTTTIGIGAGVHCHGQILVLYDMLGIHPATYLPATQNQSSTSLPRFVQNFLVPPAHNIPMAVCAYVQAVKNSTFPAAEQTYSSAIE